MRAIALVLLSVLLSAVPPAAAQEAAPGSLPGPPAAREMPLSRPADPALEEAAIRALLAEQQAAWNRADLEGFMRGYRESDDLTFFSGAGASRGWREALDNYRRRYLGRGQPMGLLDSAGYTIEFLGPDAALVRGPWRLTMPGGEAYSGLATLVLRRFPEGWRIIHDHSS